MQHQWRMFCRSIRVFSRDARIQPSKPRACHATSVFLHNQRLVRNRETVRPCKGLQQPDEHDRAFSESVTQADFTLFSLTPVYDRLFNEEILECVPSRDFNSIAACAQRRNFHTLLPSISPAISAKQMPTFSCFFPFKRKGLPAAFNFCDRANLFLFKSMCTLETLLETTRG